MSLEKTCLIKCRVQTQILTVTVLDASITASYAWVSFVFPGTFSITAGTKYWIVLKGSAAAPAGIHLALDTTQVYGGTTYHATESNDSGSTWSGSYDNYDYNFDVWGCTD